MSQVKLSIGPRSYTVNCADGEEDHITALAAIIDEKYAQLGDARAAQEAQNLLFASLFLADELSEARKQASKTGEDASKEVERSKDKIAALETELETMTKSEARAREELSEAKEELAALREAARHQHDLFGDGASEDEVAAKLEAIAVYAEATASELEESLEAGPSQA